MKKLTELKGTFGHGLKFDLKMKLTTLFLVVSLCYVHANSYSQNTKITLDLKNTSIERVLSEIESRSEFKFLFKRKEINVERIVSITAKKERIDSILKRLFSDGEVAYKVYNKQIILTPSPIDLARIPIPDVMVDQSVTINGTVSDGNGSPLPGVNVLEKGTTNGTSTDFDGNYLIKVTDPSAVLVFSYIGFTTQEITVGTRGTINVTLAEDAEDLGEVVVTGLGITREKKALGYATAVVQAESLTEVAAPNFATALYGKAPGVQISATPGGSTSAVNITIRGVNSITGSSTPLIIMDGVPIRNEDVANTSYWADQRIRGNGLTDINPEDIENISVLKGASAAALYGSQAVNGVVLITTKKGKGKGWKVDFTSSYDFDNVAYLPKYQNVRGPGYPTTLFNAGQDEQGFLYYDLDGDGTAETRGLLGTTVNFGPKFDGQPTLAWDGQIRPYEAQNSYSGLFKTAHNTRFNVALSHVSEKSNTRFSYTRMDNEGISRKSENDRNVFNLNNTINWTSNFNTNVMINYINQKTLNRPYKVDRLINNFGGMMSRFDNAEWYLDRYQTSLGYRFVTGANGQSLTPDENIIYPGYKSAVLDYLWRVNRMESDELSDRVIGAITLNWDITNSLSLRGRVSNDFTSLYIEDRFPNTRPLIYGNSGTFKMENQKQSTQYGELLLSYSTDLTEDIGLLARVGYNTTKNTYRMLRGNTVGGLSVENWFDLAASVNQVRLGNERTNFITDAMFGMINLDYKNFFFVEGTLRQDRTSTMNPDNNSFVYPSVNSSLVLSDAFAMPSAFNLLKLRASWGIVGNYPETYRANIAYNQNSLNEQGGSPPILYTTIPRDFGNDGIAPEMKHEYELGLEGAMYNGRFRFDVAYYNAQVRDQILPLTVPRSSGAGSVLTNIGTLRNTGVELQLSGTPVSTKDVQWDVTLNAAKNWNKVEKLAPGLDELLHSDWDGNAAQMVSRVGESMGDLLAHPIATDDQGRKIVDPNGLYRVDPDTLITVGNAMPKVIGGLVSGLKVKNFTLDVVADYRIGGHVIPTALNWMTSRGLTEESLNFSDESRGGLRYYQTEDGTRIQTTGNEGPNGEQVYTDGIILDGVQADGTPNDVIASNPEYYWIVYNWGGPQYSPNTRYELYIKENNYVKLRELSLGYSLPKKAVERIGLTSLNFSVYGRNLFYFYRSIKNMDAEQLTAGSKWFQNVNNAGNNPSTRTFGLRLRASL